MTLRVLHFIYDDPQNPWVGGGGAVRVLELYRHLATRVRATIVTGRYPGARDEVIDGVEYRRLGAAAPYAWSRLTYAAAANRLLRAAKYDAAIFDFSTYTPIFMPRGRPVGITVHHLTASTARARWGRLGGAALAALERRMLRSARVFSATSQATLAELRKIVGRSAEIELVHAGVPDELFTLERRDAGYLLYFGRLDVIQKGLDTLLAAFARLAPRYPSLELKVAGRGKDAEQVRALAHALRIADRVVLLGAVSDAERLALLAGARVQLMPSRFEGFGMAAAEAMAAGVPLVASRAGSLPEVVDPPAGGVLVPPDDPDALAEAVAQLLDSDTARDALSRSARESARRFSWHAIAEDHLGFLHRVAAQHGAPRPTSENR